MEAELSNIREKLHKAFIEEAAEMVRFLVAEIAYYIFDANVASFRATMRCNVVAKVSISAL